MQPSTDDASRKFHHHERSHLDSDNSQFLFMSSGFHVGLNRRAFPRRGEASPSSCSISADIQKYFRSINRAAPLCSS